MRKVKNARSRNLSENQLARKGPFRDSIAYPASGEGEERGGVALLDEVTLDVVGGGDLEQGCKVVGLMKSRSMYGISPASWIFS